MFDNGIFLSIKDLMRITGSSNYNSCANHHRALRDRICKEKKKITIHEYCEHDKIEFTHVWKFLRESEDKKQAKK